MKLSEANVKAALCPPDRAQLEIVDDGCRGLVLVVGKVAKTWAVRFSFAGSRVRMPLGRHPAVSLAQARALASAAMLAVDKGVDPRVATVETVAVAWASYWSTKAATLKHPQHDLAAWRNHIAPHIGDLGLDALSPLVFDRMQAAWVAKGLGVGQSSPLRILKGFEFWLLDRDLIAKPFMPRRIVRPVSPVYPVPPLDAVRSALTWCEAPDGGLGSNGTILALLALSGARLAMIRDLEWTEVFDDHLSWSASRMKGGRLFDQPLSDVAKAWLDRMPRTSSRFVFPTRFGTRPSGGNIDKWVAKSPLAGHRAHDLRSALATHGQEQLGLAPSTISAILDHSPKSSMGITATYLKAGPRLLWAERRAALQEWASLLTSTSL